MTDSILILTRNHLRSELLKLWSGMQSEITDATERETMEYVASLDGEIAYRGITDRQPTVAPLC